MRIIRWVESDIAGIERDGIVEILTEIDSKGNVLREIGIGSSGGVSYIAPARVGLHPYGFFDGVTVDVNSLGPAEGDFSPETFEALWTTGPARLL